MTIRPSMWTRSSSARMASTAAASAAFSSPLPRHPAAAAAARSVTRTSSRVRLRSMMAGVLSAAVLASCMWSPAPRGRVLKGFDPDQLRLADSEPVAGDLRKRLAHDRLGSRMGDQHYRARLLARLRSRIHAQIGALDYALQRDPGCSHAGSNSGKCARNILGI